MTDKWEQRKPVRGGGRKISDRFAEHNAAREMTMPNPKEGNMDGCKNSVRRPHLVFKKTNRLTL
jgi:hypothetical protein